MSTAPAQVHPLQMVRASLEERTERIQQLLPPAMAGQAQRLVMRATLYFTRKPELLDCTRASLVNCVLSAAELGLALDGQLAHAVAFKTEAVMIPDYKGLIVVARRAGVVKDVSADVVCERDHFVCRREGGTFILDHEHAPLGQTRGPVVGAYAVAVLPDGTWRPEVLDLAEVQHVRSKARSQKGPWSTDFAEMAKKSAIKRLLKTFRDDPLLGTALDAGEELAELPVQREALPLTAGRHSLRRPPAPVTEDGGGLETEEVPANGDAYEGPVEDGTDPRD